MMERRLYIAAYDVSDRRRLFRALNVLKDYSTGGQKSVFECALSIDERTELLTRIREVINLKEDRFCLLCLEPKARVRTMGIAVSLKDSDFFMWADKP